LFFSDADVAQLGVVDFIQTGTDISAVVFADRGGSGDLVRIGVDLVKKTSATLVVSVAADCDFLDMLVSFLWVS
jgi:hypothetical protein